MPAIETRDLTKIFNGYTAVDKLNLRVPEGSVYGFLGPNGAGKTTTIKMLTGLSRPTGGEIRICGKPVVFGKPYEMPDIGFLPDVPNFYEWMSAGEFLTFAGGLFNIEKEKLEKRVDGLLETVGLRGVKKKVGSYSRGMKQRLGIAQALINDPKVVFLDEPTSALDPIGRKEVMDIISSLAGKVTVFFSTHILADVERVCDRIVILHKGKMQIEDEISSLRQQYSMHCIELEVEPDERCRELAGTLESRSWSSSVAYEGSGKIKVFIRNREEAQLEIPRLLADGKYYLKRLHTQEPSLEDIFLKVVNA